MAVKTPIRNGILQSSLDCNGQTFTNANSSGVITQSSTTASGTSITTDASALPQVAEVRISMSGNTTINAPTSPRSMQRIIYLLTTTTPTRDVALHADIKKPTGTTFTAAVAVNSTRLIELTYIYNRWAVTSNLEFVA